LHKRYPRKKLRGTAFAYFSFKEHIGKYQQKYHNDVQNF